MNEEVKQSLSYEVTGRAGLSMLREQFSGQIMASLVTCNEHGEPTAYLAEYAVECADTLIHALATLPFKPSEKPELNRRVDDALKEQKQWGTSPQTGTSLPQLPGVTYVEDDYDDSDPFADELNL